MHIVAHVHGVVLLELRKQASGKLGCTDQLFGLTYTATEIEASCRLCLSMVSKADNTASERLRLHAVHTRINNPEWSVRKIAKHIGCSHGFVRKWLARDQQCGDVRDSPRSGRQCITDAAAVQHILTAAQVEGCNSSADNAAYIREHFALKKHKSTVKRLLKRSGLTFLSPKVVPMLTDVNKDKLLTLPGQPAEESLCPG